MRKALVIGINNYPGAPLKGCLNDATEFAKIIETNGDGSPNFEVQLARNVQTKAQLLRLIKELFQGYTETSLLYFSGHGALNDLGGFILAPDVQLHDEGISMEHILKLANRSESRNKVIILDCCHAGAIGLALPNDASVSTLKDGVTVLTASRDKEPAMETGSHGVFTSLLLDALQGGAADVRGNITPGSIYAYIDQAMGAWKKQRPVFKTNISEFTILRKVEPKVPLQVLRKLHERFPEGSEHPLDPSYEFTSPNPNPERVEIFKELQKLTSAGLVTPIGANHMYDAAMNHKACRLTDLGFHYWRMARDKRI
jgi:hypothetical protein